MISHGATMASRLASALRRQADASQGVLPEVLSESAGGELRREIMREAEVLRVRLAKFSELLDALGL